MNKRRKTRVFGQRTLDIILVCLAALCVCIMLLMPRKIHVTLDGVDVVGDTEPIRKNEAVFLPIKFVVEQAGYEISWSESQQAIVIKNDQREIHARAEQQEYSKDGQTFIMADKPFLSEYRTYMRADDIARMLDLRFAWDEDSFTVKLESER